MAKLDPYLHREPSAWWFVLCLVLIAAIAISDHATSYELSLSILYLVPAVIATWILGRDAGITVSMLASATWLISTFFMDNAYSHPFFHFWDAAIKFVTFALFSIIISELKIALSHADERFVTVLEGLDAAVYVTDLDGHLLYANERFHKALAAGSSLGKSMIDPSLRLSARPPLDMTSAGVYEGEFHDAEGGRWYLIRSRTIRWVDGRTVRLQLATDMSERKQARELYLQQQEKLQVTARLITVGEMASTLAHEINQPLAAIANYNMGCVRRMRADDWNKDELLAAMEKAGAQAERAGRIIQRVRELIRKREPSFATCDLNEIIEGVAALIGSEAEKSSVKLVLELASDAQPVRADAVMVEQVVFNLIKNGIEAMQDIPVKNRRLVIRSVAHAPQTVEVAIADSGPGIESALEENLFTPFFTTKPQGMGLGLHICRSIIEMHAGKLWYDRNPSGGSVFHFSLPIAQP
ncbi:MAG TPA: ATP-binding protein [Burkholderiales bacterium]|nr:ATP-binding protein [Burkholderiales bacterium]